MSVLENVREKFSNTYVRNQQNQQKPSAGSAGPQHRHFKSCDPPSAGSAGSPSRYVQTHIPIEPSKPAKGLGLPATATPATTCYTENKSDLSQAATPATPATAVAAVAHVAVAAHSLRGLSRRAIIAAREAAGLEEWRAPLVLGRMVVCGNCRRFTFTSDPAGLGTCDLHGEAAPFLPFDCTDFAAAVEPTAPDYLPAARQSSKIATKNLAAFGKVGGFRESIT